MSGDDHGHSSGHGHDAHDGPSDIIPLCSWQDKLLGGVCLLALVFFCYWGQGFLDIGKTPLSEKAGEAHTGEK